jgi:hypothetical protein
MIVEMVDDVIGMFFRHAMDALQLPGIVLAQTQKFQAAGSLRFVQSKFFGQLHGATPRKTSNKRLG